jgi:gliding motility-associated lipoprotein GldH
MLSGKMILHVLMTIKPNDLMKKFLLIYCAFLLLFSSCDPKRVYDKSKKIANAEWKIGEQLKFDVQIDDTLSYHNFYINVRNSGDYSYSNLYFFINTVFPDHKISRDTVQCILADENGTWLGKGLGDLKDNQILFKKGVRFPKAGLYSFELEQGMYDTTLVGISDIGIRIEKL